jgi:hypothetical protein
MLVCSLYISYTLDGWDRGRTSRREDGDGEERRGNRDENEKKGSGVTSFLIESSSQKATTATTNDTKIRAQIRSHAPPPAATPSTITPPPHMATSGWSDAELPLPSEERVIKLSPKKLSQTRRHHHHHGSIPARGQSWSSSGYNNSSSMGTYPYAGYNSYTSGSSSASLSSTSWLGRLMLGVLVGSMLAALLDVTVYQPPPQQRSAAAVAADALTTAATRTFSPTAAAGVDAEDLSTQVKVGGTSSGEELGAKLWATGEGATAGDEAGDASEFVPGGGVGERDEEEVEAEEAAEAEEAEEAVEAEEEVLSKATTTKTKQQKQQQQQQQQEEEEPGVAARPSSSPKKVAFMFLTRGLLPHDHLWARFFAGQDPATYSVYVHAPPGFLYNASTTTAPHLFSGRGCWGGVLGGCPPPPLLTVCP